MAITEGTSLPGRRCPTARRRPRSWEPLCGSLALATKRSQSVCARPTALSNSEERRVPERGFDSAMCPAQSLPFWEVGQWIRLVPITSGPSGALVFLVQKGHASCLHPLVPPAGRSCLWHPRYRPLRPLREEAPPVVRWHAAGSRCLCSLGLWPCVQVRANVECTVLWFAHSTSNHLVEADEEYFKAHGEALFSSHMPRPETLPLCSAIGLGTARCMHACLSTR